MNAKEARKKLDCRVEKLVLDTVNEIKSRINDRIENGYHYIRFYSMPPEVMRGVVNKLEEDGFVVGIWSEYMEASW